MIFSQQKIAYCHVMLYTYLQYCGFLFSVLSEAVLYLDLFLFLKDFCSLDLVNK